MSVVGRRYARAAVGAAEAGGAEAIGALAAGLRAFAKAFAQSPALQELLRNPSLKERREQILVDVLRTLRLSNAATNVVRLLSARDRIGLLDEVAAAVEQIADERAGRMRAAVTSAAALTDAQRKRVAKALEKRLGKPVEVTVTVNPELLGGLVCRIGDLTFDSSVKHQLEALRERLFAELH